MNKNLKKAIILGILSIVCLIFVSNDYFLYQTPIAIITDASSKISDTKKGFDGNHEYKEKYYEQTLEGTIKNGKLKGQKVQISNTYAASEVYDQKYSKGDKVFLEQVEKISQKGSQKDSLTNSDSAAKPATYTAVITESKRDFYIAFALIIMLGFFIFIGGREGALTLVSLAANLVCFYFVLILYFKGVNILAMCIPMSIVFTAMLLGFMYGKNKKTYLSFAATIISVLITTLIAAVVMLFSNRIDYDFMDYLIQPYDQHDANMIFLSEILICSMGAIMDVVVTMIATIDEITLNKKEIITGKEIWQICRSVGDEIVGTMISIMFFTNMASGIPFFILSMRNGIAIPTIIRYNSFFELARFLTGSIGIVTALPVSALTAYLYYKRRAKKC